MSVVTRFAPSPTGYLHIGGARTALFNWLFAKHHGGKFLLRVEDTDVARSTEDAKRAILEGLEWLGLDWDGDVVYQMARSARHKEVAEELVKRGQAYYCYCTAEELAAQRAEAEANKQVFRYDRRWRDRDAADAPKDVPPVVRIKAPIEGEIVVNDLVQGEVRFPADALDDFIILRSDGTPTYMHAVVVDDHDMGITHIIRGDDHLNNAGRQTIVYRAMGWDIPQFAHIPLIHGPDGAKLSKRHGALGVDAYRDMGYLPEGLRNYLLRLGWGHGDEEIIPTERAIALFDVAGIGKAPSRMDFAKMNHVNAYYINHNEHDWVRLLMPFLPQLSAKQEDLLARAVPTVLGKASTLVELAAAVKFYLFAPESFSERAQKQIDSGRNHLTGIVPHLAATAHWKDQDITMALERYAAEFGIESSKIMPVLRAAIVGDMQGPLVIVAMRELGKDEVLSRLQKAAET